MRPGSETPAAVCGDPAERIAFLERKLEAKDKTIAALMARVEAKSSQRGTAFALLEQNISLEQVVLRKTRELQENHQELQKIVEELKRTQAKLLEAQKLEAIGQLAAGIAHEVNTPAQYVTDNTIFLKGAFEKLLKVIDACVGVVAAARAGEVPPELVAQAEEACRRAKVDYMRKQVPRAVEQSLEGLSRVSSIVAAMKEFSHPSAAEKQPVDIHEAIQTTVTVARNEWKYVADVQTSFDESLPAVPCLRNEFNQVILNLVVNAAHAIAEKTGGGAAGRGTIGVRTQRKGDWVEICVSDTGTGIPERIRSRVFEPFFTTKAVGKGTGQGLAIAYSVIVDKHRGKIGFETQEGQGTTFIISLPLVEAEAAKVA